MTSVLVDSVSHSRADLNTPNCERSRPAPSVRSTSGTPTRVSAAASTASAEITQNAARRPRCAPTNVASGSPSSVPSISPFSATDTARPRTSGRVSCAHSDSATPKNACEAMPVTMRAVIITGYVDAVAASTLPARKTANRTLSAAF